MTGRNWPWSRRRRRVDTGGTKARVEAEEHLRRARQQRVEVERTARSLRVLQEENHFADKIKHLIRGEAS